MTQAELDTEIGRCVREKDFPALKIALARMMIHYPERYDVWRETLLLAVEVGQARIALENERNEAS